MASRTARPPQMRPAHIPSPTFLCYTPNGRRLVTAGGNSTVRVFETGFNGEPVNIDDCHDGNTAIVATNDFFILGTEDGTVSLYSLHTNAFDRILLRTTLPVRDLALSVDRNWVAVASDEVIVYVVNIEDMTRVRRLRDLPKPAKHVAFDPSGALLTVSCSNGSIYTYSMIAEEPRLIKNVDGLIKALNNEDTESSAIAWHPDGRAFAAPTALGEVQVISRKDWERQKAFKNGHDDSLTALAWSPNGALLVTAGLEQKICLWETKTQEIIIRYDHVHASIRAFAWHPTENILSYTTDEGELCIHTSFVPVDHEHHLKMELQDSPFIHEPLSEISPNARRTFAPPEKQTLPKRRVRSTTANSLDDLLGPDDESDVDAFVEDDDGFGYAEEVHNARKRSAGHLEAMEIHGSKRRARGTWQARHHESFQSGSTPWRGNRRYLCLNLIGCIWTVDHDTHHTVTVEFYDREFQRDFHFTDSDRYDKACLTEKGTLFSSQPTERLPSVVHYRPHDTWTTRADWRATLPDGERVTAIALSDSYIIVTTSTAYVRVYTLFGTPVSIYRSKSNPIVTCASWRDYIMIVSNGPLNCSGQTSLVYRIENVEKDEVYQDDDVVALALGAELQAVFFSDTGDPCVYDSHGVLLILVHWRTPQQARWVPILDTKSLSRLATGRKEESYWPMAVASNKFYCIILKGGEKHPYFPRPLLTDFEFHIPIAESATSRDEVTEGKTQNDVALHVVSERARLEELFLRHTILHLLQADVIMFTQASPAQRIEAQQCAVEADKVLLQLLAADCVEGEHLGMKALEVVRLLKDTGGSGKMLEAAAKIAARFGRGTLRDKISELAETRLIGEDSSNVNFR